MLAILRATAVLIILTTTTQAYAFGDQGHQAVGSIADKLIEGTRTAVVVRRILGSNLRTAAIWADCARSVKGKPLKYVKDERYKNCAVYENPDSEAALVSYVSRNPEHKSFHFTNIAYQESAYTPSAFGAGPTDVVASINSMIDYLKTGRSATGYDIRSKREAVRLLAHFVGDIHQPLHVASVYLDKNGNVIVPQTSNYDPQTTTTGGNDLFYEGDKLHAVWDGIADIGLKTEPVPEAVISQARSVGKTAGAVEDWSTSWATESLALGREAFAGITYSAESKTTTYQITLPAGYKALRTSTQEAQIRNAGARLAHILTTIWP